MKRSSLALFLTAVSFLSACNDEHIIPPDPLQADAVTSLDVTGNILGPDGTNICNSITPLNRVQVFTYRVQGSKLEYVMATRVGCPANTFTLTLPPDTYYLNVYVPQTDGIGDLPVMTLDHQPIYLLDTTIHRDLHVATGAPLIGNAYVNGVPFADAYAQVSHLLGVEATQLSSTPVGWMELWGRNPARLQQGDYAFTTCTALGVRISQLLPFRVPSSPANCEFQTSSATKFTHGATRMVASVFAGEFGGKMFDPAADPGTGWGVQYPVATPSHGYNATQLFMGGLILSVNGKILSFRAENELCTPVAEPPYHPVPCHSDFTDAEVSIWPEEKGRQIKWEFRDQGMDAAGLKVTQRSWDGRNGDYVVVRFTLANSTKQSITIDGAGVFMDWDTDGNPSDDVGATAMGGNLMYVRNASGGVNVGTLLLGYGGAVRNYFTNAHILSDQEQLEALAGTRSAPSNPNQMDQYYIHAAGPLVIDKNKSREFWIALVGGTTETEILANAAVAAQEVNQRMKEKDKDPHGIPPWLVQHIVTRTNNRICNAKKFAPNCS